MKKRFIALLAVCLMFVCTACDGSDDTPDTSESDGVLQELLGTWVSASAGELDIIETMNYYADGTFSVQCDYQGDDVGTIYGTYRVERDTLITNITEGASPYTAEYSFLIDGRELTLTDSDGSAHYLRSD